LWSLQVRLARRQDILHSLNLDYPDNLEILYYN
jgi:hypothetical protein